MGLRVTTNLASINAQRTLGHAQNNIQKSFAQLASGERITKSADDAAGLAVSETLKAQIRGFRQAGRNANDAISMVQTAEGGLNEISNIIVRLRELGVQAASDTIGSREREMLNVEVQQLKEEMQRIALTTKFGTTPLLDGTAESFEFQVGVNNDAFGDRITFNAGAQNATIDALELSGIDYTAKEGAQEALSLLDEASLRVNKTRADLGAIQSRLNSTVTNLGIQDENLSAANSRIRDADVANSTAEMARNQVLLNANVSTLAQANQNGALALKLIG
ncbi:MAG: flagellin FliC [Oligoflexia bacterium]|nr:flagellin FliC [Oligoflexia bacterium]